MKTTTVKILIMTIVALMNNYLALGQCAINYNGKTYEVIKENKTWVDAAMCAVERGGILTEINDSAEHNAIFTEC